MVFYNFSGLLIQAAYDALIELENQPVDIDADDANDELAAVEYLDELYKFYKLTEVLISS